VAATLPSRDDAGGADATDEARNTGGTGARNVDFAGAVVLCLKLSSVVRIWLAELSSSSSEDNTMTSSGIGGLIRVADASRDVLVTSTRPGMVAGVARDGLRCDLGLTASRSGSESSSTRSEPLSSSMLEQVDRVYAEAARTEEEW